MRGDDLFIAMIAELMQLKIQNLMSDEQCYDQLRELRWPEGCQCPFCDSHRVIRRGFDDQHPSKQRYQCKGSGRRFDDLTGTIFAGSHHPLKIWMLVVYFMWLNLSNAQIAQELDLNKHVVHDMTTKLRASLLEKKSR